MTASVRQLSQRATAVIRSVSVAASHPPEPELALRDVARSTTIFGRMLQQMADERFCEASPYVRWITRMGLFAYGLVELSVPRSFWNLVFRYWMGLFTLVGLILFVLGIFFKNSVSWEIGGVLLVLVWLIGGTGDALRRFMRSGAHPWLCLGTQPVLFALLFCVCVLVLFRAGAISHGLQLLACKFQWLAQQKEMLRAHLADLRRRCGC